MARKNYERSETYRYNFIRHNPPKHGYYRCVYCGRRIKKDDMQVDHIIAVKRVQKNPLYKIFIHKDINELTNLVPACAKCNKRKTDKGGLWALRGKFWKFFLPLRFFCLLLLVLFLVWAALIAMEVPFAVELADNLLLPQGTF